MPLIDEHDYRDLLDEVLAWIPVDVPEWTEFNESDPGVPLVELFSFLAENLLWRMDERQRQRRRQRSLALLVVGGAGLGALWWTHRRRKKRAPADASAPLSVDLTG